MEALSVVVNWASFTVNNRRWEKKKKSRETDGEFRLNEGRIIEVLLHI